MIIGRNGGFTIELMNNLLVIHNNEDGQDLRDYVEIHIDLTNEIANSMIAALTEIINSGSQGKD